MIGRTMAHHEIIGLLGKGGMGEVHRARDTKPGREVALRMLTAGMSRDHGRLKAVDASGQAITGGLPEPLDVQGVADFALLTPNGEALLGQAGDAMWHLFPPAGGPARPVTGIQAGDAVRAWARDGAALPVTEQSQVPQDFVGVDAATGAHW